MTDTIQPHLIQPGDADEVLEAVQWAVAGETPLEVTGGATKRHLGRPCRAETRLDLSALSGITLYEPDELVLIAGAATPMVEIETALESANQQLAFEPMDLGALLDGGDDPLSGHSAVDGLGATLGGAVACNLCGPRRIKAGSARDHVLGFSAVSGRGAAFKSGGRVVKNVTGFDLGKLIAGSYGTLAVITSITVKVLPAPEKARTVLVMGAGDEEAAGIMAAALNSAFEVSGAAHLPVGVAADSGVGAVADARHSVTALRLEGPGPSVEYRCQALRQMFSAARHEVEELHSANSAVLWREIRDAVYLAADPESLVWRISVPPMDGPRIAAEVRALAPGRVFYDWGGGLVWLALEPRDDAAQAIVHGAAGASGGHATLIRAPLAVRAAVPVFQPQAPAVAALSARVKNAFDPEGILNPGRMTADPAGS